MEKTSIIQAVFSDLGLSMVVQEASKRQMTPTTWSELGHCSKHPLLNRPSHSSSSQRSCLTLNLPNYSWLWGQNSDDFFPLLLSIPFDRYNYLSVSLVLHFLPQVNSESVRHLQSRAMKQNGRLTFKNNVITAFSLLCKDDSWHILIGAHVYFLSLIFSPTCNRNAYQSFKIGDEISFMAVNYFRGSFHQRILQ